jgi:hypothetical protein
VQPSAAVSAREHAIPFAILPLDNICITANLFAKWPPAERQHRRA